MEVNGSRQLLKQFVLSHITKVMHVHSGKFRNYTGKKIIKILKIKNKIVL